MANDKKLMSRKDAADKLVISTRTLMRPPAKFATVSSEHLDELKLIKKGNRHLYTRKSVLTVFEKRRLRKATDHPNPAKLVPQSCLGKLSGLDQLTAQKYFWSSGSPYSLKRVYKKARSRKLWACPEELKHCIDELSKDRVCPCGKTKSPSSNLCSKCTYCKSPIQLYRPCNFCRQRFYYETTARARDEPGRGEGPRYCSKQCEHDQFEEWLHNEDEASLGSNIRALARHLKLPYSRLLYLLNQRQVPIMEAIEEAKQPPRSSGYLRKPLIKKCLQCGKNCEIKHHKQEPICPKHMQPYQYLQRVVNAAKKRAKSREQNPTLKPTDLLPYPENCPVLGISLKWPWERTERTHAQDNSYSIDRLNPNETYTADNCRLVSFRANHLKSNATPEELRKIADWIEAHQNTPPKAARSLSGPEKLKSGVDNRR